MHVRIIETGHYETSAKVDDLGVRSLGFQDFIARSHGENTIAADGDRLGPCPCNQRRGVYDSGKDVSVGKDHVGFRLLRRSLCQTARSQTQDYDQCSSHYSPLPASASIVSRMRFSPRSLPLQSNHSCNVCAPPPEPPPPIALASRPSESGMLASVDARCTCAVLPSCASP